MKKMLVLLEAALVVLSISGCVSNSYASSKKYEDTRVVVEKEFDQDELEIYDYVFSTLLKNNSVRTQTSRENGEYVVTEFHSNKIALKDSTYSSFESSLGYEKSSESDKAFFNKQTEGKYQEAFDDFILVNQEFSDLSSLIEEDTRLVSLAEVEALMGEGNSVYSYWNNFYEASPESCGYLNVSNIGFNNSKDYAVIEIKYRKNSMSGYITYLVFGKDESGKWIVADSVVTVMY